MITEKDKEIAQIYLHHYSGKVQNIPRDEKKLNEFIFGDDVKKLSILKDFVKNTLKPLIEMDKTQLNQMLNEVTEKVNELTSYSK